MLSGSLHKKSKISHFIELSDTINDKKNKMET